MILLSPSGGRKWCVSKGTTKLMSSVLEEVRQTDPNQTACIGLLEISNDVCRFQAKMFWEPPQIAFPDASLKVFQSH